MLWPRLGRMSCALWFAACSCEPTREVPASEPAVATRTPEAKPDSVWVEIGDEPFELELAIDAVTRYRGLGGRTSMARNGGMLFVSLAERPLSMVMRDCLIPIDVAFLDAGGRVVAIHAMQPEPPRGSDESPAAYELRLRSYQSGAPAGFAIETAGGRLAEVGLAVGDRVLFDLAAVAARVRPPLSAP